MSVTNLANLPSSQSEGSNLESSKVNVGSIGCASSRQRAGIYAHQLPGGGREPPFRGLAGTWGNEINDLAELLHVPPKTPRICPMGVSQDKSEQSLEPASMSALHCGFKARLLEWRPI
jgi:hypothetical protein